MNFHNTHQVWHPLCIFNVVEGLTMIKGTITARHIIFHPVTLISCFGLAGYFRLLAGCLDSANHCFMDFLMR